MGDGIELIGAMRQEKSCFVAPIFYERDEDVETRMKMSDEARELKAAYQREWRKAHPGANQRHQAAYWERKAEKMKAERDAANDTNN